MNFYIGLFLLTLLAVGISSINHGVSVIVLLAAILFTIIHWLFWFLMP